MSQKPEILIFTSLHVSHVTCHISCVMYLDMILLLIIRIQGGLCSVFCCVAKISNYIKISVLLVPEDCSNFVKHGKQLSRFCFCSDNWITKSAEVGSLNVIYIFYIKTLPKNCFVLHHCIIAYYGNKWHTGFGTPIATKLVHLKVLFSAPSRKYVIFFVPHRKRLYERILSVLFLLA